MRIIIIIIIIIAKQTIVGTRQQLSCHLKLPPIQQRILMLWPLLAGLLEEEIPTLGISLQNLKIDRRTTQARLHLEYEENASTMSWIHSYPFDKWRCVLLFQQILGEEGP
mmetsp:Transcript_20994/g.26439  ORF Transcript_20994/g.26439 Transcript_20994/m.26439 type:complete len:110 (-) Transcript_20994:2512-2841(-)